METRIFIILGIIALSWHLLTIFGSFLAIFADIFLLVILSWILAFVLEPLVVKISQTGLSRVWSAALVYLFLALTTVFLISNILPAAAGQFQLLANQAPAILPGNFLADAVNRSLSLVSGVASAATGLLLIFIFSFYFLISKTEISKFILAIIPDEYEEDYLFLEKTLTQTFASFLRVQVVLGLTVGVTVLVTLLILGINFALSTALVAALLAMVPVVGSVLFLIPVALAAITVSLQKLIVAVVVCVLAAQLVYNLLAPKLLGKALKIHPIIVMLSFLVGYRLSGIWGAIFAVPVTSALAIIGKDLLKYWKQEADK